MSTMRRRLIWSGPLLLLTLSLAGCGGAGSAAATRSTPALAATATLLPTAAATATVTPRSLGTFTCPTTVSPDGTTKIFSDPQFGLSFSYPAAWTEDRCQQVFANVILIGNLFFVYVMPRQGRTIAQWVNATKTPEETVTLTPLADPHAVEAVQVTVTFPNGPGPTPQAFQPFVQTLAIVAGTRTFYSVIKLIAQMSLTDTIPHFSGVQLAQQVVSTFDVS